MVCGCWAARCSRMSARRCCKGGDSTQRMGARLELGRGVQLELEGSRHERTSADAEHRIELQWRWSW